MSLSSRDLLHSQVQLKQFNRPTNGNDEDHSPLQCEPVVVASVSPNATSQPWNMPGMKTSQRTQRNNGQARRIKTKEHDLNTMVSRIPSSRYKTSKSNILAADRC